MADPAWIVVRATVDLPRLPRDHVATVDAADPYVRRQLSAGWLVPLPAADQPSISTDAETLAPAIAPADDTAEAPADPAEPAS